MHSGFYKPLHYSTSFLVTMTTTFVQSLKKADELQGTQVETKNPGYCLLLDRENNLKRRHDSQSNSHLKSQESKEGLLCY